MLKNMKKGILIVLIIMVSAGIGIFAAFQIKGKSLVLPDKEEIEKIQLNAIRIDEKRADSFYEKVNDMKEGIEKTIPLSKWEALKHQTGENPYVVGFFYKDGTREFFDFHREGEEWFLKTEAGDVYANAEFIAEYAVPKEALSDGTGLSGVSESEQINLNFNISTDVLKYGEQTNFDLRYLFARKMNAYRKTVAFEQALEMTMEELRGKIFLSQYAIDNGCEATEEELEKGYLFSYVLLTKELQEAYEKQLLSVLREVGITKETYEKGIRATDEMEFAIANLQEKKRQEFLTGTDHLEGAEYNTAGGYWETFREHLMKSALQSDEYKEDMEKLNQKLEEAKRSYIEYFGKEF